jgi:hypothetical protein
VHGNAKDLIVGRHWQKEAPCDMTRFNPEDLNALAVLHHNGQPPCGIRNRARRTLPRCGKLKRRLVNEDLEVAVDMEPTQAIRSRRKHDQWPSQSHERRSQRIVMSF